MSDDELIVVCLLVSETNPEKVIDGSNKEECDGCGKEIYVSPTSHDIVGDATVPARLLCTRCGFDAIEADDDPTTLPPTPEQLDEIARHYEHHA